MDRIVRRAAALREAGRWAEAWKLALQARSARAGLPGTGRLDRLIAQLRAEKRRAAELADVLALLDGRVPEAARIAASELAAAGPVARILLRRTVRTGTEPAAARAAEILARNPDPNDAALLWNRLRDHPSPALRDALLAGLRAADRPLPADLLAELWRSAAGRTFADRPDAYALLALAWRTTARSDPAAFAKLVGDDGAAAEIRRRATDALAEKDPRLVAAATAALADLGAMLPGLRGAYYDGTDFRRLLFERLDSRVDIPNLKLPYPDGGQENRSVRWTGRVRIPAPGDYTFYVTSDDGVRLWVAGKKLIDDWVNRSVGESRGTIRLTKGLHAIRLEYFQGDGEAEVHLHFQGPGVPRRLLTAEYLTTPPWPGAPGPTRTEK